MKVFFTLNNKGTLAAWKVCIGLFFKPNWIDLGLKNNEEMRITFTKSAHGAAASSH